MPSELEFACGDAAEMIEDRQFLDYISKQDASRVKAVATELLILTDPAPIDEQRLRAAGFTERDRVTGLRYQNVIWAEKNYDGRWVFCLPDAWAWKNVNPQPQRMGDVFQLIERVERGKANG